MHLGTAVDRRLYPRVRFGVCVRIGIEICAGIGIGIHVRIDVGIAVCISATINRIGLEHDMLAAAGHTDGDEEEARHPSAPGAHHFPSTSAVAALAYCPLG